MNLLINIDVLNLAEGIDFYGRAFGLTVNRHLGLEAAELSGFAIPLYLLQRPAGSIGAGGDLRRCRRRRTPVHLDVVVDDIDAALKWKIASNNDSALRQR